MDGSVNGPELGYWTGQKGGVLSLPGFHTIIILRMTVTSSSVLVDFASIYLRTQIHWRYPVSTSDSDSDSREVEPDVLDFRVRVRAHCTLSTSSVHFCTCFSLLETGERSVECGVLAVRFPVS